jgi:PAS domain-containing protein
MTMYFSVEILPGTYIDARLTVVAIAMVIGGPVSAGITALASIIMRALVGGQSMVPALILLIVTPAVCFGLLRIPALARGSDAVKFAVLGVIMTLFILFTGLFQLGRFESSRQIAALVLAMALVGPGATLMLGLAFSLPGKRWYLSREIQKTRRQYRHLFEYAPIALWEEDYSEAYRFVRDNPELVEPENIDQVTGNIQEYFSRIKILSINRRAIELAGAKNRDELLKRLPETFLPNTGESFIPEIKALRDRQTSCITYSKIRSLQGEKQYVQIHWNVLPGHEDDYKRVIVSIIDATEVINQANRLQESLQHQEMLIKEIHHRVRNSLSIAYSILGLQKDKLEIPAHRRMITETQNRIQTISLIHTRLYRNRTILAVDIGNYLTELVKILQHQEEGSYEELELETENLSLHIDQVLPLGLLSGELISAGICRVFCQQGAAAPPEQHPALRGALTCIRAEDQLEFRFEAIYTGRDETRGLIRDDSLRALLIPSLVEQLKASAKVTDETGHYVFELAVPFREGEWFESER